MQRYNLGDFDGAIVEFEAAYASSRAPGLLFNLAQAHRLARHHDRALEYYRNYLRELPRAPNRQDVEALVTQLEAEIAASPASPPAPPVEPRPVEPAPIAIASTPTPPAVAPVPRRRSSPLVIGGAAGLAVGVGLLAAGIGVGVAARGAQDRIEAASHAGDAWSASLQSDYDHGNGLATTATVLFSIGGVVAGIGAVLVGVGMARARGRQQAARAVLAGTRWIVPF
jgi:hypothetical protein